MGRQSVLACCDRELRGKTIAQGAIHFEISEEFYGNEKINEKALAELLKQNTNINLVGNKAVGVALREGIISANDIIRICGIPHVQIFKI
jgi:hypothetical protein